MKLWFSLLIFISLFHSDVNAQKLGCPDPAAINFDSSVHANNGSCSYKNVSVKPRRNYQMNDLLIETSGLIWWKKKIWTHNDSGGEPALYAMNDSSNIIVKKITISNAENIDWEDITQDSKYIYIGDFGNNGRNNRTDLKIYRVAKADIQKSNIVKAAIINFSYSDQMQGEVAGGRFNNFDCEAMIAYGDSLFLFSKNWQDNKTRLYKLPKTPGTYTAVNTAELNVHGLITGAEIVPEKRLIVLTGYNTLVNPFLYLLYDFKGNDFFNGNKRKVLLNEPFTQMEGICAKDPETFYLSNERFAHSFITTNAQLKQVNLTSFLAPYYTVLANRKSHVHHQSK